jgi:serine protease Do
MSVSKLTALNRKSYNVPDDVNGVIISEVVNHGEADKKGLDLGDIVVEVNQQSVIEPESFKDILDRAVKDKKSSVLLLVNRGGDVRFVALKLNNE